MTTLHDLAGIFLIVLALGFLLFGLGFFRRSWRGAPWRVILWDLFLGALAALFLTGIYLTL